MKWLEIDIDPISGNTPSGIWDNDPQFSKDGPRIYKQFMLNLGYPTIEVELIPIQLYANLELAIGKMFEMVNNYKLASNFMKYYGSSQSTNHTGHIGNIFDGVFEISKDYDQVAMVGGNQKLQSAWIVLEQDRTKYDLKTEMYRVHEDGSDLTNSDKLDFTNKEIQIKQAFHAPVPTIGWSKFLQWNNMMRFGMNRNHMNYNNFQFMFPASDLLLYDQNTQMQRDIRSRTYSFRIMGSEIEITPPPEEGQRILVRYYNNEIDLAKANGIYNIGPETVMLDEIEYGKLSPSILNWIENYTIALSKITLGEIRSKYKTIPIPGDNITLNGTELKAEGISERNNLLEELDDLLNELKPASQLEALSDASGSIQKVLSRVPLKIYVK